MPYAAERTVARVIVMRMSFHRMINYNYLVVDSAGGKAVIVDPAWEMDKIDQALLAEGASLGGILLTHSDPDHTHLAIPLAAKHGCPIWMSREEIEESGFRAERLVAIGREPFSVGSLSIDPIFTPGHSAGSICYLIGDNLFTGDTLFAEGCGLCPDQEGAHRMFASLELLKRRLAPHTRIYPGHSYGKAVGQVFSQVLKENIYLQFPTAAQFAAYRLRKGQNHANFFAFQ